MELYEKDPESARRFLTAYCGGWGWEAHEKAGQLRDECTRINAQQRK